MIPSVLSHSNQTFDFCERVLYCMHINEDIQMSELETPSTTEYDDSTEARATLRERIKELVDNVDKSDEGWEAIEIARDNLYKRFLSAGTTDLGFNFDSSEFNEAVDAAAKQATAKFSYEKPVHYEDCRLLILAGLTHEWEKRVDLVVENISMSERAIKASFRHFEIPNILDTPSRVELSD